MKSIGRLGLCLAIGSAAPTAVLAEPWAVPGDSRVRSDFEIVANAGLLDNITTQWPIPWDGVLARLRDDSVWANQPAMVQEAARRLRDQALDAADPGTLRLSATVDGTNKASQIRGFDALGRGRASGQAIADWNSEHTYVHVQAGAVTDDQEAAGHINRNKPRIALDGSYIAERFGQVLVYGGYVPHWWGPGWSTALTLSTNARPFPTVGITRAATTRFTSPLLRWIGPWRVEVAGGLLDDSRVARHSVWDGVRVTFAPIKGLEIGIARTQILCGSGHPCSFVRGVLALNNSNANPSISSSQGEFDFRYTNRIAGLPFTVYTQIMNEDSSPVTHSESSHLVGATTWFRIAGNTTRLTSEYVSSISTRDIFSFGSVDYGVSYNDGKYPVDGTRYRGRALGFSLDSDSRLFTLQTSLVDKANRAWTLTFYNAHVKRPLTDFVNPSYSNPLTTTPVTINMGEGRVALPQRWGDLTIVARVQDDQFRPARGVAGAGEVVATVRFR